MAKAASIAAAKQIAKSKKAVMVLDETRNKRVIDQRLRYVCRMVDKVEQLLKDMHTPYAKRYKHPAGPDGPTIVEVMVEPTSADKLRLAKAVAELIPLIRLELGEPNIPVLTLAPQTVSNNFSLIQQNLAGIADPEDRKRALKSVTAALVSRVEEAEVIEGEVVEE